MVKMRLPDYSKDTGKLLKKAIKTNKKGMTEEYFQSLMIANYMDVFANDVIPTLEKGKDVVMTRAWASCFAYGRAFGGSRDVLNNLKLSITEYLASQNVSYKEIYLDISVGEAMRRINARKSKQAVEPIFENYETLHTVHDNYKKYNFDYTFDGTESMEKVYANVVGVVKENKASNAYDSIIKNAISGLTCAS